MNFKKTITALEILIKTRRYFRVSLVHQKKSKNTRMMDKKRLKVALTVLEAVKVKFPETKQFIDNTMEDECQKEKISADEVIFFASLEAKS